MILNLFFWYAVLIYALFAAYSVYLYTDRGYRHGKPWVFMQLVCWVVSPALIPLVLSIFAVASVRTPETRVD